ncbi:hypothetical protein PAL_GLEAN10015517 [Pteropus alecto]|uniref:Cilia- and flagella-associated protein 54 n=1 Tax=Pteropus alecto TaxID=9402 RepID=L5KHW4_PTEAL|nr:hypothetical protein PAL_GLEAN10015517 [Pteropus alecto]
MYTPGRLSLVDMAAQASSSASPSNMSVTSVLSPGLPPTPPPTLTAISKSPLESKASLPRSTCREDSLPLAVFYGPLDAKNPLLASFEKEIQELLGFMKRKKALATTEKQNHEFHRRCATSLFNIWTKYAPRLPAAYYNEKLLKVGDSLCEMKEYKMALLQCYGRYLQQFSINFDENQADVHQFKMVFFPKGFGDKTAANTALEYLLWASICMESSVPLLSVRYLTWRATLYTAVCQCYYDCQAGIHGEAFARRALAKIDELRQLELMSSSQSQEESRIYYREATIKLPWPRTVTERLLDEMFDSTASQFLAVLEALSDSNRRTLQTGPVVTDEVEVRDVVLELFIAGKELLIMSHNGEDGMFGFPKTSLLQLIIKKQNVISLDAAVKFIKLAFTYEEWSLFDSSAGQLIDFLQRQDDPESKKAEKDLTLLLAIEPLINVKRNKGLICPLENHKEGQSALYEKKIAFPDTSVRTYGYSEDIFHLAATLYSCVCTSPQNVQPDKEIVVDMIMFLWQKCKLGIQRINMSRNDYAKFTQKIKASVKKKISESLGTLKGGQEILPILKYTCDTDKDISKPVTPNNFIMDLHLELIQAQHRVAVVLLDQLQELSVMNKIRKNKLSKAIYLMQKALLIFEKDATSTSSHNFLTEAYSLIEKAEVEQNNLYTYQKYVESSKRKKSRIPPPPIVLSRTHCSVTLKPAPFISDVKIPADGKSIFEVKGLESNEKYIFAIAAYSSNGKLVGDAIGETTKPILVYPPLSAVTARMFLTQVAYQIDNYELAKKVFSPVWDYFVASPPHNEQSVISLSNIMTITQRRRNDSLLEIKKMKYKDSIFYKKATKPVKKFKAVIMEIGRPTEIQRKRSRKRETLRDFFAKNPSIFEMTEHERNKRPDVRKIAHRFLVDNLNPLIFSYVKKKRFHQICLEEMPWKAQMNLYLANAHFNLLLIKLRERMKMKFGTSHTMVSFRSYDPNMFSLYNSGTVLPTGKMTIENYKVMLDFLHTAKKRKANLPSDAEEFMTFINSQMIDEKTVSKAQTVHDSDFRSGSGLSAKEKDRTANLSLLDHFMKIFLYCRRAMVLAYRGGFWTLLQNYCRALWNFTQELQILLKQTVDVYKIFPISQDGFICTSVLPFYLGAEFLIDMLLELQNTNSIQIIEEKGEFSVPSCYGNIKNDNGGSSLIFEHPLDDVNVVDLKWIHDFVLKSLELLYQVEKWETLVSLAIQFNAVSHERYTEQVTPLLVYAQRQLLLRISKYEGPDIIQQPCGKYEAEHKEKITCRNFIGKQLKINPTTNKLTDVENWMDLLRKLISSEYSQAKKLVCVPVDVTDTLRCFRETLEKSKYHNRSIRHSRKLLSLFLAQTQGDKGGINNSKISTGKVEFCLGIEEMHMPTPPDLSQEHFRVFSSVEKSKLPHSQLGLVISSYYETIDVLQASNQRSLKVQALHELGSLLIFAEKRRAAFKCWCQALDDLFKKQDVLHTWKELCPSLDSATDSYSPPGSKDYSEEFLSKVGIWGCLQGAIISAKIAQFIKILDVEERTNCCILSALLFQGLLRTTLPHPKAERCYAQYEITQLLPGIELFSDRYRADICSVVASLYYIIHELHFVKQNIIIEVLIDLTFFSEAFHEMSQIFYGKNMPSLIPTGFKTTGKVKSILLTEAEDKLNLLVSEMEHPSNRSVSQCSVGELEMVVEARLQLAAIALQRHRSAYSAAIVFSTLKLLQDSKLFKKKVVQDDTESSSSPGVSATENKDDNEFLDPISLNSREYFNIHLWLRCRLALVTAFVAQIRGIGIVKENDMTNYVSLVNEVCVEAKNAGDRELQAEFLMQAVIIGLQEKHLKADIITNLQMLTFGETVEFPSSDTDYASPLQPLKNVYLPHVMLLAKTKMRIGHTVAKQLHYNNNIIKNKKKDPLNWLPALQLFEIALKLCKISATEEREVEAEILFQKVMLCFNQSWRGGLPAQDKVSEAVLAINLLIGKKNARTDKVSQGILPNIPEFATVDLLSSYSDYLLDNYQVVFQTGYTFFYQSDDVNANTDANKKTQTKVDITWILLLRYYIHLQRINNMSKLLASPKADSGISLPDDTLFTSLFNSGLILRQKEMHIFLRRFLQLYSSSCIDEFPKELLQGLENPSFSEKVLQDSSGKLLRDSSLHSILSLKVPASPSCVELISDMATHALNKELCFQWYIPPLERPPKEIEPMVLLLYAYNTKPLKIADVKYDGYNSAHAGSVWVPLNRQVKMDYPQL